MLIDAHVHIDEYNKNLNTALDQIRSNQIVTLAVSMDIDSYRRTRLISDSCDYIIPSFGIHPWKASQFQDRLDTLDDLVKEAPMIGEIGLDHRFTDDPAVFPYQNVVFEYFLDKARNHKKIVNLHTSGAELEVVEKLEEYHITQSIVHWYNGPLELIDRYLSTGSYFTIGVELLFSPKRFQTILDAIPNDRLLTETDNPVGYQWLCGEIGMPEILYEVIAQTARYKKLDEVELNMQVTKNIITLINDYPDLFERVRHLDSTKKKLL